MKQLATIFLGISFLLLTVKTNAQVYSNDFKLVDDYVKSLGKLDTLNMGTISYIVTKNFTDNRDKVRAIFDWIANNISFDIRAAKLTGNEKINTEDVLKKRMANASGYAVLFQDMCSVVKIRCLTVDGFAKNNVEQITDIPDEMNHTWAVVQLGQSPESWYYVDPTWGSGFTDDKMSKFTKSFNDAYFFADKNIFNLQHFPDNMAWQLGSGPKSKKDFFALPIVKNNAYDFKLNNIIPLTGHIKINLKKPVAFSFKLSADQNIEIVALQIGTDKKKKTKTVDYTFNGGTISFNFKFDEEDSYPVTVLVNNLPVLGYFAEISE